MKRLLLALIAALALPTTVNAEDNPFATKPRYGHDPFYKESIPRKKLTDSEDEALSALCKIGLNADGGIWDNDDNNAAIASIERVDIGVIQLKPQRIRLATTEDI